MRLHFWPCSGASERGGGKRRREIGSMRFNPKEIQSEISPPRKEGGTAKGKMGRVEEFSPLGTDLKKL